MKPEHRKIAEAVAALFTEGIQLNREVLHYLDSTAGINTPDAFVQMMASDDFEAESLCELIFFPDETQQVRLEPLLEDAFFTGIDIARLTEQLCRTRLETVLIFPEDSGTARLPVPETAIHQFVRRLKLDRIIESRVAREIDHRFAGSVQKLRLRVALRNARFAFSEGTVEFLCAFVDRIAPDAPDFMDLFVFSCDTLERIGPAENIYGALMARKRLCAEMIRQTQKSEQQLRQQPVEALMLRGVSISCMDVDEARRHIGWIDRISMAIYGKTDLVDRLLASDEARPFDLGIFEKAAGDIDKVIKILS